MDFCPGATYLGSATAVFPAIAVSLPLDSEPRNSKAGGARKQLEALQVEAQGGRCHPRHPGAENMGNVVAKPKRTRHNGCRIMENITKYWQEYEYNNVTDTTGFLSILNPIFSFYSNFITSERAPGACDSTVLIGEVDRISENTRCKFQVVNPTSGISNLQATRLYHRENTTWTKHEAIRNHQSSEYQQTRCYRLTAASLQASYCITILDAVNIEFKFDEQVLRIHPHRTVPGNAPMITRCPHFIL
jgi:hypothetical protein